MKTTLLSKEELRSILGGKAANGNNAVAGMSIINGGKATSIFHRLKEWYSWGYLSPKDFERKYKVSTNDETKLIGVLKDNLNLAHTYNVQHTPSIIHNGIKLSTGVSLVDVLTQ